MTGYRVSTPRAKSPAAGTCVALVIATLALAGCGTAGDTTGSIAPTALPSSDAGWRDYGATWARRHDADPGDKTAALNYARALRALTQYAQATAILEGAAVKHPYDREVLAAYGKSLADTGRLKEAADVLSRAHTPDRPDWTVLSAQGSVADQMGDHAGALGYYQTALKIAPGEPTVLSNLGLSYALAKDLPLAESTLRDAAGSPRADVRVRQNLALVLALEGKFGEAEALARRDLPPADAARSVAAIRQMTAQSDTWRSIQTIARRKGKVASGSEPGN